MAGNPEVGQGRAGRLVGLSTPLRDARGVLAVRAGLWLVAAGILATGVLPLAEHGRLASAGLVVLAGISGAAWLLHQRLGSIARLTATVDVVAPLGLAVLDRQLWAPAALYAAAGLCEASLLVGRRGVVRLAVVAVGGFAISGVLAEGWRDAAVVVVGLVLVATTVVPLLYRTVQHNRRERVRLHNLLDGVEAIVWELDRASGQFTYVSGYALNYGVDAQRWLTDPQAWVAQVHPDDRHLVGVPSLIDRAEHGFSIEVRAGGAPDYPRVYRVNTSVVDLGHPSERRIRGVVVDISDLRRSEGLIRHQARHDALTNLANRGAIVTQLAQELAVRQPRVALLLLDLDRFKEVNDALGHHRGDILLQEVAARLRATIPPDACVGRLGGDEFAVVVPLGDRPDDYAEECAEAIVDALGMPVISDGLTMQIGVSIGIAVAPTHGEDQDLLFRRADMTMYVAKRGGGGWQRWAPEFEAETARSFHLAGALREALDAGEVGVVYQPRVSIRSGQVLGFEALARWTDPALGEVGPAEFVAAAQVAGVGMRLVSAIVRTAVADLTRLRALDPRLTMAINVTTTDLVMHGFEEMLDATIDAFGIPAESLILELSEPEALQNAKLLSQVLGRLARRGIRLSIDDFGQGYASMDRLRSLPLNEIKIDDAFVSRMRSDPTDRAIVASIIQLGQNLALEVVAEGVEDRITLDVLRDLGCGAFQGRVFAAPMPIGDALSALHRQQSDVPRHPLERRGGDFSGLAAPHP